MKLELVANIVASSDGLTCNDETDKCPHNRDNDKSVVGQCRLFDSTLHKDTGGKSIRCGLCHRFDVRKV